MRRNLTPEQERIARYWEGGEGTNLPAGITLDTNSQEILAAASARPAAQRMSLPRVVRALALMTVAMADAGVAAWDGKYVYWTPRPINGIRDLGIDPNWEPLLATPRFPAYPSGSAGYAGAAQAVMTYLFPEDAERFRLRAQEQAEARLYAGVHWRFDSVSLEAGRNIGNLVVERARSDGADRR